MDTAVWLGESKEELPLARIGQASVDQHSVGHYTVEALRRIGVLDELVETSEGIVVYPKEMNVKESILTETEDETALT